MNITVEDFKTCRITPDGMISVLDAIQLFMGDTGRPAYLYWQTIQSKDFSTWGRDGIKKGTISEMGQNTDSNMNQHDDPASPSENGGNGYTSSIVSSGERQHNDPASPSNNGENGYSSSIVSTYKFPGQGQHQTPVSRTKENSFQLCTGIEKQYYLTPK